MTTPTNHSVAVSAVDARERLLQAALRVLAAERGYDHADSAAEAEHADDLLAIAARDLTRAFESAPVKPAGW